MSGSPCYFGRRIPSHSGRESKRKMKKNQNNILAAGHAVAAALQTINEANATPALQNARKALTTSLADIASHAGRQADPLPPRTRERNQVFDAATDAAYVVGRLVLGYALQRDLVALAGQVDLSATDLGRGRLTRRVQQMRQVQTAAHTHAADLTEAGVTAEVLKDLDGKIAAAEAAIAQARSNIASRRIATENLQRSFARLEQLLRYSLDPLMETYRRTDPDTHTRYETARVVIDRPGVPTPEPQPSNPPAVTPAPLSLPSEQRLAA